MNLLQVIHTMTHGVDVTTQLHKYPLYEDIDYLGDLKESTDLPDCICVCGRFTHITRYNNGHLIRAHCCEGCANGNCHTGECMHGIAYLESPYDGHDVHHYVVREGVFRDW